MSDEEHIHLPHEETIIQYLKREIEKIGLSEREVGEVLGLDQSAVSRLLNRTRGLNYDEAYEITLLILKHVSSIPDEPVNKYYTSPENVKFIYSDEPVLEAVKKMKKGKFTQLPVFERDTNKSIGIVTDWALLRLMLHPPKSGSKENWLNEMKNMLINDERIRDEVIDQVPKYPPDSPLIEVAEGLMHHYAVLIGEEMKKEVGIITRADFLKLLKE